MLKAGVALRDITPPSDKPYRLAGYPEPADRASTGVNDPLYASGIYLFDGSKELLIIAMDLVYYTKHRTTATRALIEEKCGIPAGNIMIDCTHTHSGPNTWGNTFKLNGSDELYPEYIDFLQDSLVSLACEAKAGAFDASVGIGKTICGKEKNIGGNRHDPSWPADPEVWVVAVRDSAGKLRGTMVQYSLHPTLLHADNTLITADYPAYIREYLTERHDGLVFGFLQGTSGNQSTRFFRSGQTFDEAKRYGYTLGEAADGVIANLSFSSDVKLNARSEFITPPLKDLPAVDEAKAIAEREQKKLDEMNERGDPYPLVRSQECRLIGANYKYNVAQNVAVGGKELLYVTFPMELQLLSIGDTRIVGMAGETFVEYGLRIKAESPYKNTFVVTLANGPTLGYMCTPKAHAEGGYEALGTMLAPEAGDIVTDKILEMLKES